MPKKMNFYRLIQGNCFDVLPSLEDESIDLVLTDPPYNVGLEFEGEDLELESYLEFSRCWIQECYRVLKKSGAFFMTYYSFGLQDIIPILKKLDWKWANMIIWRFPNLVSGGWSKTQYEFSYQPILFFTKKDFKIDIKGRNFKRGTVKQDVWVFTVCQSNYKEDGIRKIHPAQKPLDLFKKIIEDTSNEGDVVLDPFLGSGTTIRACQETRRSCIGIELDARYCEMIKKRCFHRRFLDREVKYGFEVF